MAQAERLALQSDLAWVGQYNGAITGDVSERMVTAIKEFQKARGGKPTGVLNPQERGVLADTARRKQENVGWKIVTEPGTGVRLGIPTKLVPQQSSDANGAKWTSPTGTIQIQLARRKEASPTTAKLAEREKKEAGRNIDYTVVKPDFFVLSGLQGLKKFYLRGTFKGDEVRILTILYDQAMENTVEPVVIAMSSAFNAFPTGAQIAGPPPRKTVEYGTGVVVSDDGAIVTDRLVTDGCIAIAIAGYGNADRVAEDKEHDLALLRIYGARGLKPLNLASSGVEDRARPHRNRRSAEPGRRRSGEQLQGLGRAARRQQRCRAVAAAGARLFRRGGARWRRQIRRDRVVEAGGGRRTGERRPRSTGGAGARGYRARFPQGPWRQCVRRIVGCQGVGGARDLRAEVVSLRTRFSAQRCCAGSRHETMSRQPEPHARAREPAGDADRRAVGAPAGGTRHPAIVMELDRVHAAGDRRHRQHLVAHRGEFGANALAAPPVRPPAHCPRSRPAAPRPLPAGSCHGRSD